MRTMKKRRRRRRRRRHEKRIRRRKKRRRRMRRKRMRTEDAALPSENHVDNPKPRGLPRTRGRHSVE